MSIGIRRLRVADYFDSLVNEIDLKAETLLAEDLGRDETLINTKREVFINEIKQLQEVNLNNLDLNESEDLTFSNFAFMIDKNQLGCSDELSYLDNLFGYLVKTGSFLNTESVDCFKQLLEMNGRETQIAQSNSFFSINKKVN
jgi:hypothetical protein